MKLAITLFVSLLASAQTEDDTHYAGLCDITRLGVSYASIPCRLDNGGVETGDEVYQYPPGVWGTFTITLDLSSGPWPWIKDSMHLGQSRTADYILASETSDGSQIVPSLLWGSIVIRAFDDSLRRYLASNFARLISAGIAPYETRSQNITVNVSGSIVKITMDETINDSDGFRTPTQQWLDRHAQDTATYGGAKPRQLH